MVLFHLVHLVTIDLKLTAVDLHRLLVLAVEFIALLWTSKLDMHILELLFKGRVRWCLVFAQFGQVDLRVTLAGGDALRK